MKAIHITKYETSDGRQFDSPQDAESHETLTLRVREIMRPLDIPAAIQEKIDAHKGYYQHDIESVYAAREGILAICREEKMDEHYPAFKHHGREVHPLSIVGRILDDHGGALNDGWRRFAKIDPQGREWQQCFYAYTQTPNDQPCLNP